MNFLKQVMQKLDDHSLGLLGAVLGENESKVREAVKSALPKILDAMVSASEVDQGRAMLWRELRDTDTTVADSFSKQMYYRDSRALAATGRDQLDGLIGDQTNRLVQSVSRESDIGSTSAKRLVNSLTPLVFAFVADHQQSKQLNQNELGDVLEQQKHHLTDWDRQNDHYFSGFSDLTNAGKPAVVASASLGDHQFGNYDEDQKSDSLDKESVTVSDGQQGESEQRFDQRSHERRLRKPIAVNPAHSGFGINSPDHQHDHRTTSTTNTYDSKNAVSGFAAAVPNKTIKPGETETDSSSADHDASGKLWTPATAHQRSADGTLQYADHNATANRTKISNSSSKRSDGWFHWLWWPVLILGSLLGVSLLFLNPADYNGQISGPTIESNVESNVEPAVSATSDRESSSGESDEGTQEDAVDSDADATNENFDSDILTSGIQISPSESDGATDETTAASGAKDEVPFLEGSIEIGDAVQADETAADNEQTDSVVKNERSAKEGTKNSSLPADLGIDADEQVEEVLTAIETTLEEIGDESNAEVTEKSLTEHISRLKKVLATRGRWQHEIEMLVDFQLEEGQKMLAQAREEIFQSEAAKKIFKGKFKKLNELMKTADGNK